MTAITWYHRQLHLSAPALVLTDDFNYKFYLPWPVKTHSTMTAIKNNFKRYNGGKSGNGTYQQIINHIPLVHCYVEAMVGGGGVFRNLKLPDQTVINDYDGSVIEKYRHLESAAVIVRNDHYAGIIKDYGYKDHGTLIYFDPPYLFSTRKSQKKLYKHEWSDIDHRDFIRSVKTCTSAIIISHYPCTLYDEELKDWNKHTFKSMTSQGLRDERIYFNYKVPIILQDFRYVGTNFTERQRIKRKATRLKTKLQQLPSLERTAVLSAVIDMFTNNAGNKEELVAHETNFK